MSGISIEQVEFSQFYRDIERIRLLVFVEEQGVPIDLEMDERDPFCQHFLAYAGRTAIGTARIDLDLGGKIGRLAVLREWRQKGIGTRLMLAVHQFAKSRGVPVLWCHAQLPAQEFYGKLGYIEVGQIFDEAGIDHIAMYVSLTH